MMSLNVVQLNNLLVNDENLLLINTLSEENFSANRIPNSINIPQDRKDFTDRVAEVAGRKDRLIVLYCASDECSSSTKAAEKLEQSGFTYVCDFESGADGWKAAGNELESI